MVPGRRLAPYFAEFLPAKAGREAGAHQHEGCEFLYLLSGSLNVRHGDATHRVEAGDSVYFDANTVHSYLCAGDVPATAVIVTLQHAVANPGSPPGQRSVAAGVLRPGPEEVAGHEEGMDRAQESGGRCFPNRIG